MLKRLQYKIYTHFVELTLFKSMNTYVANVNPTTGKQEWIQQMENYDYDQEIARSAYGDMLHDTERNVKYEQALKAAIDEMKSRGKEVHVLDIGTGTGLLSMMAARHGADKVTACEAFKPMASCAKRIIKSNGLEDKISLIPKRSTEITVGPGCDMQKRANILVTEVFDTELIGEGGIGTFHHAHKELLQKDCLVVPSSATLYAQVVNSPLVERWNTIPPLNTNNDPVINPPAAVISCTGTPSLHDVQLTQLNPQEFEPISDPIPVFWFDYSGKSAIQFKGHSIVKYEAKQDGTCHAVFMWWDLQMDQQDQILLSCAPKWANPAFFQWRDHWMQAIYYPESRINVMKGQELDLHSCHDEYSLWFNVTPAAEKILKKPEPPVCTCGAHISYSRSRLGMLSDAYRLKRYWKVMSKIVQPHTICLCISDGSLLPLMAAQLGAKKVYVIEPSEINRRILQDFSTTNHLSDKIHFISKSPSEICHDDIENNQIGIILGEPYFSASLLPWHHLYFWYAAYSLQSALRCTIKTILSSATIRAVPVQFENLGKIRAPVKTCQGFDLSIFDDLIQGAITKVDAFVEPQPLWEYPAVPLGDPFCMMELDLTSSPEAMGKQHKQASTTIQWSGLCNGVALWVDFKLIDGTTLTTGLLSDPRLNETLQWDKYSRQGVHLFRYPINVNPKDHKLEWKLEFDPKEGNFIFDFTILKHNHDRI